jgi:hypothetical protein
MAARVHMPLKVVAFDATLLSETHLKPHERLNFNNIL